MSYKFMKHKTNGIAQLYRKIKNKFNNVTLSNNWIKHKLD